MAATHYPTELDSGTDSVTSTPRSYQQSNKLVDDHHHQQQQRVRFMCSFGGKILPRPTDNQLRYIGGDTRIVAVNRNTSFSALLSKLSKITGTADITVRYQLPNEDLDALITVTTDEDVENMMEEFERIMMQQGSNNDVNTGNNKTARLRLFLFPNNANTDGDDSRTSSICSLLDGSSKRENFFLDALNGGGSGRAGIESGGGGGGGGGLLERGRSEASSVVSEVPDYLFGFDNSDELIRDPKLMRNKAYLYENIPNSDPGSPALPVVSSPFGSTSSAPPSSAVPPMPNLPPVKTKPDSPTAPVAGSENLNDAYVDTSHQVAVPVQQPPVYTAPPVWNQYHPAGTNYPGHGMQPVPVYYVAAPGPVPHGHGNTTHVQAIPMPQATQYIPHYGQAPPGQVPSGIHQAGHHGQGIMNPSAGQIYGGAMRPVSAAMDPYEMQARIISSGPNQPVYYGVKNGGVVASYPGNMMQVSGDELPGAASDVNNGRVAQA